MVIEEADVPATITGDFAERLARAIHRGYVANARARGETETVNPSTVPWDRLPEDLRQANIAQAAAIGDKLRTIGATVVPDSTSASDFAFTDQEIELLARQEHDRWMRERRAAGWTYGVPRDNTRKHHPYLRDWQYLDQGAQDKDREAARAIPEILHAAGYNVTRLAG
jgi:hypothetical protein